MRRGLYERYMQWIYRQHELYSPYWSQPPAAQREFLRRLMASEGIIVKWRQVFTGRFRTQLPAYLPRDWRTMYDDDDYYDDRRPGDYDHSTLFARIDRARSLHASTTATTASRAVRRRPGTRARPAVRAPRNAS